MFSCVGVPHNSSMCSCGEKAGAVRALTLECVLRRRLQFFVPRKETRMNSNEVRQHFEDSQRTLRALVAGIIGGLCVVIGLVFWTAFKIF